MLTQKRLGFIAVQLFSIFLLAACGGGGGGTTASTTASVSGAAQKGNFVQAGTTVTAYQLNDDGTRSTTTASGSMTSNGAFSIPDIDWTGWTEIEVTGKYIDETKSPAAESTDTITLTSLVNVDSASGFTANINILTHMQAKRAKQIIANTPGTSITDADAQALGEVQSELLGGSTSDPAELNITSPGTDNEKLLVLSGAFLTESDAAAGTSRQDDLDALATDFSDGTTDSPLADAIGNKVDEPNFLDQLQRNLGAANQGPTLNDTSFAINENLANSTVIVTLNGTDPENDPLTYSITAGNDSNVFALNSTTGEITVVDSTQLDKETTPSYSLTVEVSDGQTPALTDTATITISVTDVNEAPSIADKTLAVAENSANNTVVGTQTGTDPDGNTLTYSITGGNTNDAFSIDPNSGEISVNDGTQLNAEGTASYSLTVQVSDGQSPALTDTATVTVNITDVNEAPSIENNTFNVAENSANNSVVGTQAGTDPDGNTLTYSIIAGNDNSVFAINPVSGEITVNDGSKLDAETPANASYGLTVQVSDGQSPVLTNTALITINVTGVNEAPSIDDKALTVEENSAKDTVVGTQTGTDPDGNTLTYSITNGNTNDAFAIDAATGEITVNDSAQLDADTPATASYSLTVEASDGQEPALTDTATITVTVTGVNEAPSIEDKTLTVAENSPNDTVVGKQEGTDPEDDTLTYSITAGNDDNVFAINDATGSITVNDGTKLDAETPANASYALTVQVSDGQMPALTDDATITINVTNVDEAAVIAFVRPESVPKLFNTTNQESTDTYVVEWAANGTVVGEIDVTSLGDSTVVDGGRTVSESDIVSQEFEINANNQIVVKDSSSFDASLKPFYELKVVYTTGSGDSNPVTIKVYVHQDFSLLEPKVMPLGDSITYAGGISSYRMTLKQLSQTQIKMNIDLIGTSLGAENGFDDEENEGWNGFSAGGLMNEIGSGLGPKSDIGATPHYCDVAEEDQQYFPFVFDTSNFSPEAAAQFEAKVASCVNFYTNTGTARSIIDFSLAQQVPDMVLIHIGTNDFFFRDPATSGTDGTAAVTASVEALGRLVEKLRTSNPNVVISIAQIIPLLENANLGDTFIPLYNSALETFVDDLNTADGRTITLLVDQYTNFDTSTGLAGDGVHPNDAGNIEIGTTWFESLKPVFGISDMLTPPAAPN